ncbi:MAG: hypothetical protein AABW72_00315 [archaeon]
MLESIKFEAHALMRLRQRSCQYGLSFQEARKRIIETIKTRNRTKKKHIAKTMWYVTYYRYFSDNLSFYVICKENKFGVNKKYLIKTIIIEYGRG